MRSMTVFNYLLEATVFGSVLILLLLLVRFLFRDKLGSRFLNVLWLAVALRLLLPLSFPNPLMDEFRPGFSVDLAARPVANQIRERTIDLSFDIADMLERGGSLSRVDLSDSAKSFEALTRANIGRWALIAWLSVACAVACAFICQNTRELTRLCRNRVRKLSGAEDALYRRLCERCRVKPIPVYFVDRIKESALAGTLHPWIALPLYAPEEQLSSMLTREICHHKTWDGFWALMRRLCCVVHWFNPLVWLAARLNRTDIESACDERAIARMPDAERIAYIDMLAHATAAAKPRTFSADARFSDEYLKKRVNNLINARSPKRWAIALASALSLALLILSFATRESEPLPTVVSVPEVTWAASLESAMNEEGAIARARRFLESAFVRESTDSMHFQAYEDAGRWRVLASRSGDASPYAFTFRADGCILEYNGLRALENVSIHDRSYTHTRYTVSLQQYISAFFSALLPGAEPGHGTVTDDLRAEDGARYVFGHLKDANGTLVYELMLQVEPAPRVLSYRTAQ